VETVAQALKLPYATILLQDDDALTIAASYGKQPAEALTFPLIYQRETIGQLQLAPRSRGEAFTPADMHLLNELTHQVSLIAHTVRLTADLQRSNERLQAARERLVTTREEERRRLRRDLHDGSARLWLGERLGTSSMILHALGWILPSRRSFSRYWWDYGKGKLTCFPGWWQQSWLSRLHTSFQASGIFCWVVWQAA